MLLKSHSFLFYEKNCTYILIKIVSTITAVVLMPKCSMNRDTPVLAHEHGELCNPEGLRDA